MLFDDDGGYDGPTNIRALKEGKKSRGRQEDAQELKLTKLKGRRCSIKDCGTFLALNNKRDRCYRCQQKESRNELLRKENEV
jgi:ribosomal protein S27AE